MIQENIVNTDLYLLKWTKHAFKIRFYKEYRIEYLETDRPDDFSFQQSALRGTSISVGGSCLLMENYNFLSDLLDTFQSSSDLVKIVCLLIPLGFVLAFIALLLHHRTAMKHGPHRTSYHYPAYGDYNDNTKNLSSAKTPPIRAIRDDKTLETAIEQLKALVKVSG